jgi:hypothetical protein
VTFKFLSEDTPPDIRSASYEFISVISSKLCLLQLELETGTYPAKGSYDPESPVLKKIKKRFSDFLSKLSSIEGITDSVLIHSYILAKKVYSNLRDTYFVKPGEFFEIFQICCFLSIKYVVDVFKWFACDFAIVSDLSTKKIVKMEIFVLHTLLKYELCSSEAQYLLVRAKIYDDVARKKKTSLEAIY